MIDDSGSVPEQSIFSPRETSPTNPESIICGPSQPPTRSFSAATVHVGGSECCSCSGEAGCLNALLCDIFAALKPFYVTNVKCSFPARQGLPAFFFFTRVTGPRRSLSLKLSGTRVYEPQIRARLGTRGFQPCGVGPRLAPREREFFIDNLLVRVHFIIVMIRWTGLAV